ncbi:PepSY-like domain-containing protein [Dyadobacter psychrotolerans]|uniref:Uncharacterized protein n=1 Tax=Dyadobacter psychrotolerans TaxID=2541721 RepID=A0A4R5DQD9_9BACT|nr:PepSY-like domain-containing protein [Dyadobacter psychrotolerans]TDE16586.1 hypothetical protein E0F88_10145 [Dyadobacter psychrotolerans]
MKKFAFVLVLLSAGWFVSCQKDNGSVTPVEELSDVESVVSSAAARYAVAVDSVTVKKCKGKLTEVAAADLAVSITTYISTTYAGSEIKYAAKDESGRVVVAIALSDGTLKGLLFKADGTFQEELKQHVKKAKLTKVEISALPAVITTYITANYAGSEVKQVAKNADGEYFVGILIDSKIKILLFNADGSFSKELEKPAKQHGKHK